MGTVTHTETLKLEGFSTTSDVKGATLSSYTHANDNTRFGASSSYATGYAVRATWITPTIILLPASQITGLSFIVYYSDISRDISTRYGALESTGAKITSATASTTVVPQSSSSYTINLSTDQISAYKTAGGIGFGGAVSTAAYATINSIDMIFTINAYHITYNKGTYGTGTNYNSDETAYSFLITLPGVQFTRTGYQQKGWSTNANGTTLDYKFGEKYPITSNTTLYPYWERDGVSTLTNNGLVIYSPFIV